MVIIEGQVLALLTNPGWPTFEPFSKLCLALFVGGEYKNAEDLRNAMELVSRHIQESVNKHKAKWIAWRSRTIVQNQEVSGKELQGMTSTDIKEKLEGMAEAEYNKTESDKFLTKLFNEFNPALVPDLVLPTRPTAKEEADKQKAGKAQKARATFLKAKRKGK